jgi:uncharacterized protein YbjT (DUF2867 family)
MTEAALPGKVGVLGATSLVGTCLLPLVVQAGCSVTAYSRRAGCRESKRVDWRQLPVSGVSAAIPGEEEAESLPLWICMAPLWVLPDYFALLEAHGVRRVVALSSTSRFTKHDSPDPEERSVARRLAEAEARVQAWAEKRGVEWLILRPTLIYGWGLDQNISAIARFIQRFGFFPLIGQAGGLRQPLHVEDVAAACLSALMAPGVANQTYNISGGETLTYREMVRRIFAAQGCPARFLTMPIWAFRVALAVTRFLPRFQHLTMAMAERMNRSMVYDHMAATRDFGFSPRAFRLSRMDLPQ